MNIALLQFNEGLRLAGSCMGEKIYFINKIPKEKNVLSDYECRMIKKSTGKVSNFIKTRITEFRLVYLEIQKMCKKLLQVEKASQMEQLLIAFRESWYDHHVF